MSVIFIHVDGTAEENASVWIEADSSTYFDALTVYPLEIELRLSLRAAGSLPRWQLPDLGRAPRLASCCLGSCRRSDKVVFTV